MEAEHVQQREVMKQAHQQQMHQQQAQALQHLHAFLAPPILSTPAAPLLHQPHHNQQHLARALSVAGGLPQGPQWAAAAGLPPSVPQEGQDLSRISNMLCGAGM